MDTPQEIGATIRRLRQERGLTQLGLAAAVGIHANSLARIERADAGYGMPDVGTLLALAQALDVGLEALLGNPRKKAKKA